MSHGPHDHCRNCFYWDRENLQEDGRALCKKHESNILAKGWCEKHFRKDPLDKNDPAVKHDYIVTREILKAQGTKVRSLEEMGITI